jgi:uncharacterized protein
VLLLPLTEASAKVRSGPPLDDEEDYELPIWAGVVPLRVTAETPVEDPRLKDGIKAPEYAQRFARPRRKS